MSSAHRKARSSSTGHARTEPTVPCFTLAGPQCSATKTGKSSRPLTSTCPRTSRSPPRLLRAFLFSIKLFKDGVRVVSDCVGVLMCWRHGMSWSHGIRVYRRGLWRDAEACKHGASSAPRLHRLRRSRPIELWTTLWTAAQHATCWARSGLTSSRVREAERRARDKSNVAVVAVRHQLAQRVAKTAVTVLALNPAPEPPGRKLQRQALAWYRTPQTRVRVVRRSVVRSVSWFDPQGKVLVGMAS